MEIRERYDLSRHNTFGLAVRTRYFAAVSSDAEARELFAAPEFKDNPRLFLGGGSNILFTKDFDGIVIENDLKGIEISEDGPDGILVRAASGEPWHAVVELAAARGWWGIENLALIPGTVGAAPMQNVGAYGGELRRAFVSLDALDVETGEKKTFTNAECRFGYRDSVFKRELKGKYFITSVTLRLSRDGAPNVSYKILRDYLAEHRVDPKTSKDIADAVSAIRRSKLPDPAVIGNAGSFFKNVILDRETGQEKVHSLRQAYPDLPTFEEEGSLKIPAAWLIERAGWKGYRDGDAGVHDRQALVLVNHGRATGAEIKALAERIIASVREKFGLELSPEVNIV